MPAEDRPDSLWAFVQTVAPLLGLEVDKHVETLCRLIEDRGRRTATDDLRRAELDGERSMREAAPDVLTFEQAHTYRRRATLMRGGTDGDIATLLIDQHDVAWREMRRGACAWVAARLGQSGEKHTEVARLLIAQIAEEIL
jgi:hypothetical protein